MAIPKVARGGAIMLQIPPIVLATFVFGNCSEHYSLAIGPEYNADYGWLIYKDSIGVVSGWTLYGGSVVESPSTGTGWAFGDPSSFFPTGFLGSYERDYCYMQNEYIAESGVTISGLRMGLVIPMDASAGIHRFILHAGPPAGTEILEPVDWPQFEVVYSLPPGYDNPICPPI